MKKNQFLLLKLMEECAEVSQRASKSIQFGAREKQNTQSLATNQDNAERLRDELTDLLVLAQLLVRQNEIAPITKDEFKARFVAKVKKMQKYLDYSHELGELPEINLYDNK